MPPSILKVNFSMFEVTKSKCIFSITYNHLSLFLIIFIIVFYCFRLVFFQNTVKINLLIISFFIIINKNILVSIMYKKKKNDNFFYYTSLLLGIFYLYYLYISIVRACEGLICPVTQSVLRC